MGRINFLLLATLFLIVAVFPKQVDAAEKTSRTSAVLAVATPVQKGEVDYRAEILQKYLEKYDSPLAPYAQTFIDEADKNNIDWKLVPSISGVESYFGQQIPQYSYNGWGYGVYGNNVLMFASWKDAIARVSYALRTDYKEKWKAETVYQIGAIYAQDPRWSTKVSHFIEDLDQYELLSKSENSLSISL
jgi:hypothetical protein